MEVPYTSSIAASLVTWPTPAISEESYVLTMHFRNVHQLKSILIINIIFCIQTIRLTFHKHRYTPGRWR